LNSLENSYYNLIATIIERCVIQKGMGTMNSFIMILKSQNKKMINKMFVAI